MKKISVLILGVGVIALACLILYLQQQKTRSSVERILPQGAFIYVRFDSVQKNIAKVSSMPLFDVLKKIDYQKLVEKNVISDQQMALMRLLHAQLLEVQRHPISKKLFGNEVALAVYQPDVDVHALVRQAVSFDPKMIVELLSGVTLVTRVDSDIRFAEFASRFFGQYQERVIQKREEYKGETIHSLTVTDLGMTFGIVRLGDLMVIGIGDEPAKRSVDAARGDQPSLAIDDRYAGVARTYTAQAGLTAYLNIEKILKFLEGSSGQLAELMGDSEKNDQFKDWWSKLFERTAGLTTFGFSAEVGPVISASGHLFFSPREIHKDYASVYACPPEKNKTIHFIPKNILGYQWANCFKLDDYWRQVKQELATKEQPVSKLNAFETNIGLNVEQDILPAFGDEIGGYLSDLQTGGFFPIPKFVFFVEIADKSKAQKILDLVKNYPLVSPQEEQYKGRLIKYFASPLGESIQPGYCFLDDYLLVALSMAQIKESIDAAQDSGLSLQSSPSFKQVNFGLTDSSRSVQFIKIGQAVEKLKVGIHWANQWMNARDQKSMAFQSGSAKPLAELIDHITAKEDQIDTLRKDMDHLDDEIWNAQTKGEDATELKIRLNKLDEKLQEITAQLEADYERKRTMEAIVEDYDQNGPDTTRRQAMIDEVVNPLLEGLKSVESYAMRSTVKDNAFITSLYLSIHEQ